MEEDEICCFYIVKILPQVFKTSELDGKATPWRSLQSLT
ncbi:hypothetical protein GARC_2341 [Paraglaciecola arctica BSs20135]|uniref:Uncharacterized protein n=1 Tax=Paraglaciecola arctica BSs20135 TaxID=493475 RepID=K6YMC8_9ALTE|nr:hypothetical protein GARC_2341 [Paraglaciecola arctica BSs20135]